MQTLIKRAFITVLFLAVIIISINWKQQLKAMYYFDKELPGNTPKLFGAGVISDGLGNRDMAISPNGDELFYTIQQPRGTISAIMYSKKTNGTWSLPEVAVFSGRYNDLEPAFSPDGSTLYFSSNRPLGDTGMVKDYDIWRLKKVHGTWAQPENAGTVINSGKDEFYAAPTKSGNLYFTRDMGEKKEDIVVAKFINGNYASVESLSDSVNSAGYEFNAYVDPEEKFIIFTGYKRKDDLGGGDLYISFKKAGDEWTAAKNLGTNINSTAIDYCPFVSFDKKYLFFTSSRSSIQSPLAHRVNAAQLKSLLSGSGNGFDDIYWVDARNIIKK